MKRFKKKTYLLMALLLLMSSILAACSQDNGSTEWTTDSVDDLKMCIRDRRTDIAFNRNCRGVCR